MLVMIDSHKGNSLLIVHANQVSFYNSDISHAEFPQTKITFFEQGLKIVHQIIWLHIEFTLQVDWVALDFNCFARYSPIHKSKQSWILFVCMAVLILQILNNYIYSPDLYTKFQTV